MARTTQIPRIIHYCWLSGSEKPRLITDCIATWKKVMPDYEMKCWDAEALKSIDARFAHQAYRVKQWAFAADYLRLHALYHDLFFRFHNFSIMSLRQRWGLARRFSRIAGKHG